MLFFKLVRSTTYFNACILLRYFVQIRFRALRIILKCYSPRASSTKFPVAELQSLLAFDDRSATVEFFEQYGLPLEDNGDSVNFIQKAYSVPELPCLQDRAINVIESKRNCSIGDMVAGGVEMQFDFEEHIEQDSFDEDGMLIVPNSLEDLLKQEEPDKIKEELVESKPAAFGQEKKPAKSEQLAAPFGIFSTNQPVTNIFGGAASSIFGANAQMRISSAPKPASHAFDTPDTTDNAIKTKAPASSFFAPATSSQPNISNDANNIFGNFRSQPVQQQLPLFALPIQGDVEREKADADKIERDKLEEEKMEQERIMQERIEDERREAVNRMRLQFLEQQRQAQLQKERERLRIELEERKRQQLEEEELRKKMEKERLEKLEREMKRRKEKEELRLTITQVSKTSTVQDRGIVNLVKLFRILL